MKELDSIFDKIDQGGNIQEIRYAIADLIIDHLKRISNSLGYWEKSYFASAIAALAWNINSSHQPTTSWLRLSLVNIENALIPPDQRNESYTLRYKQLNSLTCDQLINAIIEGRQAV